MPEQAQTDSLDFSKNLGILTATLRTARKVIEFCTRSRDVPCLIGEAGIGKTAVFQQVADDFDWNILFYYLAHVEPEDILGIPVPDKGKTSYQFYVEKRIYEMVNSNKPTLLVFDEWNRGDKAVMNAAFPAMESRRLGSIDLPDHVHIGAAMNPSEGTYLVNEAEKDPAFRRRMCFVGIRVDKGVWEEWARGRGNIHYIIRDFIHRQDQATLLDTVSRDAGKAYANPAGYEKASNTFKVADEMVREGAKWEDLYPTVRVKLAGHLGAGVAEELLAFHRDNAILINPHDVLEKYHVVRQQVLGLIDQGKHGALTRAADAIATTVASGKYDPEDFVDNLSDFSNDLPHDISGALFTKISNALNEAGDKELRSRTTRALGKCPAFKEAFKTIIASHERVEEDREAGNAVAKD